MAQYGAHSHDHNDNHDPALNAASAHSLQIPVHCGHPFRRIADSVPVIADSF